MNKNKYNAQIFPNGHVIIFEMKEILKTGKSVFGL